MWTTGQIRYLDENCHEGAEFIAAQLGKSVSAVQVMASRRGVSLKKRYQCPKCGATVANPLNSTTGWCANCTKEERAKRYADELAAEREEVERELRANKERQRLYSQRYRARKKRNQ